MRSSKSVLLATSFALLSMLTGVESNGLARLQNKLQHEVSVEGATDAKEFPYHQDDAHGGSFEDAVKSLIRSRSGTFVAEKFGRLHDVAYYDTTVENGFEPRKVFDENGFLVQKSQWQKSPAKLKKDFGYGHEVRSACVALNKLGSDLSDANLKDIVAGLVLLAGTIHSMEGHTHDLKLMLTGLMGQGDYKAYGPCMVGKDSFFAAGPESIVGKIRGALKGITPTTIGTMKDNAAKNTMADYMSAGDKADFYGYRVGGTDDGLCLAANMFGEAMMYGGVCRGLKAPKWCKVKFSDPYLDSWQAYWGDGQDKFYNFVLKKHGYGETVMADSAEMKRCTQLSTCEYFTNRCKFSKHAWVKK